MPRKGGIGQDERAAILKEARRIIVDRDESALAPTASLTGLAEVLADTFDETYTVERVVDMLDPARRRSLKSRFAAHRPTAAANGTDGVEVWLPMDVVDRLKAIAEQPEEAIRALLDSGRHDLPEPGSEEHCRRRRCSPQVLLSDPAHWTCQTCGLGGRVDQPLNPIIKERLADQQGRIGDLHALAAGIYETWGAGDRFTMADCAAHRLLDVRGERDRLKHRLPDLVQAGLIEDAPGPRGGAGYRVLDEPPDWIAEVLTERREQRETEARVRDERAAMLQRALEEGLTHVTPTGETVEIAQNGRGLELRFPSIPSWELREEMKRQGHCRWDGRRRRWCRMSPVATVEPWLAAALDAGATVAPLGTADPDAEDWGPSEWPD
ncbi:hypothetical protein [Azospirillum doebereinerae]|uniref:Uncharacterized protein n=1 Tax=Azospirillum doebereinerae TaxID=92933 RepID=A0A3S0WNT7_9PROT|nr:hypothetical protein [Azospirillum doebereinerae]RUQ74540.1 hypothetical protein EJ913_05725 [Azospirillum doebereinerae]